MKKSGLKSVLFRVAGTAVLIFGFVVFMARAPFLAGHDPRPDMGDRPPLTSPSIDLAAATGALTGPVLPTGGPSDAGTSLQPSFGLFNADFAAADGQQGFSTSEHAVQGPCRNAGERYFKSVCPDCAPLGGDEAGATDMLMWEQTIDGNDVIRSVSRHCIGTTPAQLAVVGSLTFDNSNSVSLANSNAPDTGDVPLLAGASRVVAITLGNWSATYDDVARPSSAISDMTEELERRGWREVTDHEAFRQDAFQGQRVFTNSANWLCMISLTRQGDGYQLLTIINSQA